MKYLTNSGLSYFFNKLKTYISNALSSKANSTHTHSASDITSGLATVATSGSYNDLSNKPTIPTVNNATLTIQKNGTTVKTFTANASSNVTANITVPTKVSELTNDSGFLTSHQDLSGYVPKSGGAVMTGAELGRTVDTSSFSLWGGSDHSGGAKIDLFGKNNSTYPGCAFIRTVDANNNIYLMTLKPDGTLTWGSKNVAMQEDVIPRSGGAVFTGDALSKIDDTTFLAIRGGSGYNKGAQLTLYGKDAPSGYEGYAYLMASDGTNISQLALRPDSHATILCRSFRPLSGNPTLGDASYLWGQIYSTNSTISTSDSRLKNTITDIDDSLLDAWENIEPKQYKFNDATEEKGDKARYHTGYLAQDIQTECEKQGVNASDYGLFCYDEWDEQEEISEEIEKEKDGKIVKEKRIIQPKREKGDRYSLRYAEALVVECKYLRRENSRLKENLASLEERLEKLEKSEK